MRLRIINAGGDTAFRFGVTGHQLTITHTDGYPVAPHEAESVVIGMGERYDAILTAGDGVFAVIAEALGKVDQAVAILSTGAGSPPPPGTALPQARTPTVAADLTAADDVALGSKRADRTIALELTGTMEKYDWAINGTRMNMDNPLRDALAISEGTHRSYHHELDHDVASHASAWTHVPAPRRRPPQGHLDRAPRAVPSP
ncbi:cupredoxin domain-containing protein [Leucobacter soli]|uniref:hypothetical protein n=1 Tax=Leucobacter soli TaxID=2812850 RepID=UPI0036188B61